MIRTIFLNLILIPSILSGQDSLKTKLNKFLDEWHAAAARADMKAYFEKIDEDSAVAIPLLLAIAEV